MATVHITDFGSALVNPQPIVVEDTEFLLEDYLSSTKMKQLTGVEDLDSVKFLEMRVDTTETSLGNFGTMVPNLKQLKLNGSVIATVRDLGTSLVNLNVLWMARCCLGDLDGMGSMTCLQELYLAYNHISDLSPCSMLDNLQMLDVEGNNIDDIAQVEFLSLCTKLDTLTLDGNPVCMAPSVDYDKARDGVYDYRAATSRAIPQLLILDDEPLDAEPSSLGRVSDGFNAEWLLVSEAIKGSDESLEVEEIEPSTPARPSSASRRRPGSARASGRPGSSQGTRPGSSQGTRPGSSQGARPGSSQGARPGSAGRRPGTSAGERPDTGGSDVHPTQEDASDLTHGRGGVMCGNPVRALRNRRRTNKATALQHPCTGGLFAAFHHQPEHTYRTDEDDQSKDDIFSELRDWKQEHEAKMASRVSAMAPQVLTIHHGRDEGDDDDDDCGFINNNSPDLRYDESYGVGVTASDRAESSACGGRFEPSPPPPLRSGSPRPPRAPKGPVRPRTANDFRSRRVTARSEQRLHPMLVPRDHDDDGLDVSADDVSEVSDSSPTSPTAVPYSPPPMASLASRPFSGPIVENRNFKPGAGPNKPRQIDRHQPIIRSAVNTPPNLSQRLSRLARPSTARAAMQMQRPPTLGPPRDPRVNNSYDLSS